jgi:hydrogenase maturation protease
MNMERILIAGVGNIFFGDDAFGVEVLGRLAKRPLPPGVNAVDFGIRGIDLTYALLEPYDAVILVDAVTRGGEVGTLYVLEPEIGSADAPAAQEPLMLEPHALDPAKVLRLARSLGGTVERIFLVGCEVRLPGSEEGEGRGFGMEMSPPVRAAVVEAVGVIESLVAKIRGEWVKSCTSFPSL